MKSIPLSFALYALQHRLVAELSLFLHLKEHSPSGMIHVQEITNLFKSSGLSTRKTFDKQLSRLIKHHIIRKHQDSQYYKLVSLSQFCKAKKLNYKRAVKISQPILSNILQLRAFLFAAIVANFLRGTKFYYTKTKQAKGVSNGSDAHKPSASTLFGVSMNRIKQLLGKFSRTYINRMKLLASKFGYLKCFSNWIRIGQYEFRRSFDLITSPLLFQNKYSNIRPKKKCAIIGEVQKGDLATFSLELYLRNKGK